MLLACLDSLCKQTYSSFEVIVVDNGSTDGTEKLCASQKYEGLNMSYHQLGRNTGFAYAINYGCQKASEQAKYIALLNNDCIAAPDWLKELVLPMEGFDRLGMDVFGIASLAFQQYGGGTYQKEWWCPGFGTTCFFGQTTIDERFAEDHPDFVPIFAPGGGASIYLFPKEKKMFDEDYFAYGEDTLLGFRKRQQGSGAYLNPKSIVYHKGEGTSRRIPYRKIFYQERNRWLNVLTCYEAKTLIKIAPLAIANLVGILMYDFINAPIRLFAICWLLTHPTRIIQKRRRIQQERKVTDYCVTASLSGKYYEEKLIKNSLLRKCIIWLNKIQLAYCRLVKVVTKETVGLNLWK